MRTSRVDWLRFSSKKKERKKEEECVECWQFSKFTAQSSPLASNNGNLCLPPFPASSQSGFRSSPLRSGCPSCHVEWRFTWLQLILFPQLCSNANSTLSSLAGFSRTPPPPSYHFPSLFDSGKAVLWHSSNPIEATKLLIVCPSIPLGRRVIWGVFREGGGLIKN